MENNLTNDFEVRKATLAAMEGDMTKNYANIFEVDLAILEKVKEGGGGGGGAEIDDNNISTGKVWSSNKVNTEIANVSNNVYSKDKVDGLLDEKQDTLESGVNIKTINNLNILGAGNIDIQGGGGVEIDDTDISTGKVWSSNKVNAELTNINTSLNAKVDVTDFLEAEEVTAKALNKLNASIGEINEGIVDISTAMNNKVDLTLFNSSIGEINGEIDDLNNEIADISTAMNNKADVSVLIEDEAVVSDAIYNINTDISTLYQEKVYSGQISNIYALTQAEYDDIEEKDEKTMYVITDAL